MNPTADRIRTFLVQRFPAARTRRLGDHDHLLENGILDSLGVLDVVQYLEKEFHIAVTDDDLLPETFSTVAALAAFVERRVNAPAALD